MGKTEGEEELADGVLVRDESEDAARTAAARAGEDVEGEGAAEESGPVQAGRRARGDGGGRVRKGKGRLSEGRERRRWGRGPGDEGEEGGPDASVGGEHAMNAIATSASFRWRRRVVRAEWEAIGRAKR